MKAIINAGTPKVKNYPYIGIYEDVVVFFTAPDTGICLMHPDNSQAGKYASYWDEKLYSPLTGSITLSND